MVLLPFIRRLEVELEVLAHLCALVCESCNNFIGSRWAKRLHKTAFTRRGFDVTQQVLVESSTEGRKRNENRSRRCPSVSATRRLHH